MSPMSGEPPTLAELWRRVDQMQQDTHDRMEIVAREQREQFSAMNARLDKMLTSEGLATYMGAYLTEMRHLRKDHDDFETETKLRFERNENKTTAAVRWAITAVIAGAGVIVATIGQIIQGTG